EPARTMILEALQAGRHVVTANKDLVAEYGRELLDAAEENHCDFLFEAAVAGGIPIIRPLKQCLAGNDISEVIGIVNGTTNYILTKMFEENMSFESALAKATELGYAEADPTADVEGLDAGRKVAIMASIAFHSRVVFKDVYTEGITRISPEDIAYAKEFDSVIKLLGVAHNTETGIEVGVYPMLLNKEHPLASVRDSFNAVFVHGDAVDDAMFYGRGAGELPTASAVVGDIIDVARDLQYGCMGRISCTCYRELPVKDFSEVRNKFFLRMQVKNQPGVLACIAQVFGDHKVSIARVVQKHVKENQAELVIVTEKVKEYHLQDALTGLKEMESILEISSIIREY
ncbi:MAG: homoserine dehydrogenase, partial [Clostridium sp.]|nr:homoserine dehydrogenase [Clostridium sp.]